MDCPYLLGRVEGEEGGRLLCLCLGGEMEGGHYWGLSVFGGAGSLWAGNLRAEIARYWRYSLTCSGKIETAHLSSSQLCNAS